MMTGKKLVAREVARLIFSEERLKIQAESVQERTRTENIYRKEEREDRERRKGKQSKK